MTSPVLEAQPGGAARSARSAPGRAPTGAALTRWRPNAVIAAGVVLFAAAPLGSAGPSLARVGGRTHRERAAA